jgi:hypothetical protein
VQRSGRRVVSWVNLHEVYQSISPHSTNIMDEFDKADAAQRMALHKETMKTGRNKPPPKSRNKLVHIALEGDSQSLRKLQTNRVTPSLLRKLFGVEVDHLTDQFHTVCTRRPVGHPACILVW